MANKKTIDEIMEQVVIFLPDPIFIKKLRYPPNKKEREESDFLLDLTRKVYKEELACSKIRIDYAIESSYISKFPAIRPAGGSTTYFPQGLYECVEYLTYEFGKEDKLKQYYHVCYPKSG